MFQKLFLFPALLCALCLVSCKKTVPAPVSEFDTLKSSLQDLLKKEAAAFSPKLQVFEDENAAVTLLKSKTSEDTIQARANQLSTGVLLSVFNLKDKKTGKSNQYKSSLVIKDTSAYLSVVQLDNQKETRIPFETFKKAPGDGNPPPPPPAPCDIDACIDYFNAYIRPGLQAQANSTCKDVWYCLICPISGQPCVAITFVIKPTRWRCLLIKDFALVRYAALSLPLGVGIVP